MKKFTTIIVLLIALMLTVGASRCTKEETTQKEEQNQVQEQEQIQQKEQVTVEINDGEGAQEATIELEEGMSAYDVLVHATNQLNLQLDVKEYENMGISVESIGNKKGGDNNMYWMFYVNDEMPPVAADKQELKAGDKVRFSYEESTF